MSVSERARDFTRVHARAPSVARTAHARDSPESAYGSHTCMHARLRACAFTCTFARIRARVLAVAPSVAPPPSLTLSRSHSRARAVCWRLFARPALLLEPSARVLLSSVALANVGVALQRLGGARQGLPARRPEARTRG
eukprot:294454-Pleurochrysis_carterae.AAC.1